MIIASLFALTLQSDAAQTADHASAQADMTASAEGTPGQDIEWAATVASTRQIIDLPLKAGLTEAQKDTCAQIADRMGSWRLQRVSLRKTTMEAEALRYGLPNLNSNDETGATPALLELISALGHETVTEGDRAGHALMSAWLAFCRP